MRIDFHTHLLPNLDDGNQSVEESLAMLDALHLQNVDLAVATPHFYSSRKNLEDFLEQRDRAYGLLVRKDSAPKLLLGAEVSFFRGMGKADRITELAITGTNALLIEMPFSQWGRNEISELHQLLDRGITPILAHIERYFSFQKDLTAFNEIINLPVFLQVNTEALLARKTRRFVFKLIEHDFPVLLGTDCHNMKKRRPEIGAGRQILLRKYGAAYLEQIDALGEDLLKVK